MDERTATVNIGGQEYEMLLTTRATKAIAGRYGGLENLGEKLMKAENFEMALDEIVWLITLLCNQPILVHIVYPAFVLRHGPPLPAHGGSVAHAVWPAHGSVGMPQAVFGACEAKTGTDDR